MAYILWHLNVHWPEWNTLSSSTNSGVKCKYRGYRWKTEHGKHVLEGSGITLPTPADTLLWLLCALTHTQVYMVMAYYNHTQPSSTHAPTYRIGRVAVLTQSGLNGHLRWIIVCEWKLGQIISVLLAQGWVRPLSPSLHTHTHTLDTHTQLLFYHLYFQFAFIADSLPFTIAPCPCVCCCSNLSLPFLQPLFFPLYFSPLYSFPNNSGLYPAGHSPLCGCPCQCLQ